MKSDESSVSKRDLAQLLFSLKKKVKQKAETCL